MSISFELIAEHREDKGRGASRRLRRTEKVPAVIYGAGKEPLSITLDHNKTKQALAHEAFYSHILKVKLGAETESVILKAIQRHPAKPRILHIDFLRIDANQKLHMHVPLHFIGAEKAEGVKAGGIVSHILSDVEISCLPKDLPEYIEVDISRLELNQSLSLSDLVLPKGVEVTALAQGDAAHDAMIVNIHLPRIVEEPTEAPVATEVESEKGGPVADINNKE